jgi:signal transduction histidine kinase/CheY-like chemotaxis protein
MRIIVTLAGDRGIGQSLRAALPENDLLLIEPNVDETMKRLIGTKADLLIVDDTPRLRPDELVKVHAAHPDVPMLVLSARYDTESLAAFIVAGARRCVAKPFTCEALLEAVDALTARPPAIANRFETLAPVMAPAPTYVHQHQSALRWMSRHAAQFEDPTQLAYSVVDALVDVFDTNRAAVLLLKTGAARVVASHGLSEGVTEPLRLAFATGLMRWLDENGCLFDRRHHPEAYDAQKEMGVLKARLAFPIVIDGQTRGAVLLGEKSSGGDYSAEERELLSIMSRSLATGFARSRHYREVSRQQHRVDAVLSNITTGVITVRHDKTVSMMNEAAERLLSVKAADALGKSVQKLGSAFADPILRTLRSNTPTLREKVELPDRGVTLGISVTPVTDEGVAAIFASIPRENEALRVSDDTRFWEYLSSRVAQEIKNPMVAINTFAQLLPTKYDSKGFRDEFADIVQAEVARINSVVEKLYAFARPANLNVARVDLNGEVQQALAALERDFAEHAIGIETTFDDSDVSIAVDSALIAEAMRNVLQNSIDSMRNGGTLRIATKRNNGWCELFVSDSGAGISDRDAPLIFLPFYSTKEQGMGLGLTMAQRIAVQHNGRLDLVESEQPGAAFALRLPPAEKSGNGGAYHG